MTARLASQRPADSAAPVNLTAASADGPSHRSTAPDAARSTVRIGYLVNLYPSVSHTFIRREIEALERLGFAIDRFSIRRTDRDRLADDADLREHSRTLVLLRGGGLSLLPPLLEWLLRRPLRLARAATTAVQLWRRSHVGLLRHVAYLMEACRLASLVRRRGIRHVHAHFGTNPASVALLANRLCGVPFSFTMHGSSCFDAIATIGIVPKVDHASFVVAVSRFGRSQILRFTKPHLWGKVHVVHCGLPREALEQPASPVSANPRLVCVARLAPEKGHFALLEAIQILASEGRAFTIALVGDGPARSELEAAVTSLGIQRHVEFMGSLDGKGVVRQLAASRALVLPSLMEGLPVVAMEAFAAGRPVIATAVAGVPELVRAGETGWLVSPGDPRSLAEAMAQALDAPSESLEELAKRGRAMIESDFVADRSAAMLADLLGASHSIAVEVASPEVKARR